MKDRDFKFDNIKGILIFLVVFAHFLESFYGSGLKNDVYKFIYTFHMPVFIFVSGYFAKFNFKKILCNLVYPYIIFQVLYCAFFREGIQFFTPKWLMWYLFVMVIYYLSLGVFKKAIPFILPLSVILSVFAGFSERIGYPYSLSRLIYFYPFFLLGFWVKNNNLKFENNRLWFCLLLLSVASSAQVLKFVQNNYALYGSVSYQASNSSPLLRVILYGVAVLWIFSLLKTVPAFKIPLLSDWGRYSICIFLLHGFIVKSTPWLFAYDEKLNILLSLALTFPVCFALGNKFVFQILNPIFKLPLQTDKNVIEYNTKEK